MLTWPTALFSPPGMTPRMTGASQSGGQSVSTISQYGHTSGGGLWIFEFAETPLLTPVLFKVWQAIARRSDNGATPFVVPLCDRRSQPFIDPKRPAGIGFGDDSVFADGALWAGEQITASIVGSAALRATSLRLSVAGGKDLEGGEYFTVWHSLMGQRLYEIVGIDDQVDSTTWEVETRPPLRQATPADIVVDFDNPRCQMRADGDLSASLEMLKRGRAPQVRFVEDFRPATDG